MSDSSSLPPVRLRPEAELARDALMAPLLARAVRLARWAGSGTRVTADGALTAGQTADAAREVGGADPGADGDEAVRQAWRVAVGAGLVELPADAPGTVTAGPAPARPAAASPGEVLGLWRAALDTVLEAAVELPTPGDGPARSSRAAEAAFVDAVLAGLYALSPDDGAPGDSAAAPVPLPALAASAIVPDGMRQPTDEVLEQVSGAVLRLDPQFRLLADIGLVDYEPVDETLLTGDDHTATGGAVSERDISRYGMVRLTPLGRFGLRARLREAGHEAPVVGELAEKDAVALLAATAAYPQAAAEQETGVWLASRAPLDGARELLAAARGADDDAPLRRLRCQQALSLIGPAAEPALREVLDDAELGGLARVWLAERGASDVPPPTEKMVFWLTVDTLAAQLAAEGDSAELRALVADLERQHSGFFDTAWRVDHPATARVLEALGRLHPDRRIAKEARRAAYKARSQAGG